jgi:alpha-L-fucosidase
VVDHLTELGNWLKANGEAIYGTSPWFVYGQGPSDIPEGNYTYHHNNHFAQITFTKSDIRFTVKGDHLYAICLGKPDGDLKIEALNTAFKLHKGDILKVTHLSTGRQVSYSHNEKALVIDLESIALDEMANAFRIERDFN